MDDEVLNTARAENWPTGSRRLPPPEGQAAADNGSNLSVGATEGDAFDAGKARAALHRSAAGGHDDSDDSGSDVDVMDEQTAGTVGLSSATRDLIGPRALGQAFTLCASSKRPTGQQPQANEVCVYYCIFCGSAAACVRCPPIVNGP